MTACSPGESHGVDERRIFTRLQSAFAGMLDHADQNLARLVGFLEETGMLANTIVLVTSDNGASQEGGPLWLRQFGRPAQFRTESFAEKLARIDEIGGPKTTFELSARLGHGGQHAVAGATSRIPTAAAFAIRW